MAETETSVVKEAEEMMMQEFIENLLPKVKKYIMPVKGKLAEWMGDDEKVLILRKDKQTGELFLMVVETEGIKEMSFVSEDSFNVYPIDDFVDAILEGRFDDLE